jgi:hypothetical protein
MDDQKKSQQEFDQEISQHQCNLCECDPKNHVVYWSCPIFKGDEICQSCCQVEMLRPEVADIFSHRLGQPMTLDEINQACNNCGKNYGLQNPNLADKIENSEIQNEVPRDKEKN